MLENGYELEYAWVSEYIVPDFPEEQCSEVHDILDMHEVLQRTYAQLEHKSGIDEGQLRFHGFDGNRETGHMAYARHLVKDEGKFTSLENQGFDGFNSHMPTLDGYRSMVAAWKNSPKQYQLTKEDVIRITSAR